MSRTGVDRRASYDEIGGGSILEAAGCGLIFGHSLQRAAQLSLIGTNPRLSGARPTMQTYL
jgi:hypothetical protein